jgi:hypothetical protein
MHEVSLHPQKIFRTTSKSENHMQNGNAMQKKLKIHAVSINHTACLCACGVIDTVPLIDQLRYIRVENLHKIFVMRAGTALS